MQSYVFPYIAPSLIASRCSRMPGRDLVFPCLPWMWTYSTVPQARTSQL